MEENFKFRLKASGGVYRESTGLVPSLYILYNYSEILQYCMGVACGKYVDKEQYFPVKPQIELEYVRSGSLLSSFFIDFPAAYAMIQPLVGGYAWELLKLTFDFIKLLGEMRSKREIPAISLSDSPGSLAIVINGNNNIIVTPDVFHSAKKNMKHVSSLAGAIGPEGAESLNVSRIVEDNRLEPGGVLLDRENSHFYADIEEEFLTEEERPYQANIYRLNTKTRNGLADIGGRGVSFEVKEGDLAQFINALHGGTCYLHAKARMVVNSFGETRLDHLFVVGISPFAHKAS